MKAFVISPVVIEKTDVGYSASWTPVGRLSEIFCVGDTEEEALQELSKYLPAGCKLDIVLNME